MNHNVLLLLLLGIAQISFGQNLNMIIDVNEALVTNEIRDAYLNFENKDQSTDRIKIGYHPGELLLESNSWDKIRSDETVKITLSFNYFTLKKKNQEIRTFEVEMKKYLFEKEYLILHVYDFRERKYRRKYGCLTDEDYITDFNYPQGGILVSCN